MAPPAAIVAGLADHGWTPAADAGWEWIVQSLNPEPDQGTLPLIGKDYLGHEEVLALRRSSAAQDRQLVLRLWDSGVRLQPGDQVLYLGQLSLEVLAQRLRLISYWQAQPAPEGALEELAAGLEEFVVRPASQDLLLIRHPAPPGISARFPAGAAGAGPGR